VLVQGAGGGVATALVALGAAAGARMWVTSRSPEKASRALELGAERVFGSGERLPDRVDAVMETVGAATWTHSLRSLRPGGVLVVSGATSGYTAETELNRVFFLQLRVLGSTMGSRDELTRLVAFLDRTGLRPPIHTVLPLSEARDGFALMERGDVVGKVVFTP
ncbi:zinc-binding dehydrogenase, partial [Jiangella anatolica]